MAIIFAAIIQFASIYERQIGIENAAREVGRRAATLPTNDGTVVANAGWALEQLTCVSNSIPSDPCYNFNGLLASNVQEYSGNPSTLVVAQICYANAPALDPSGNTYIVVDVTIKYAHPIFMPLVASFFNGIVTTNLEFRVEGDAGGQLTSSPTCAPA